MIKEAAILYCGKVYTGKRHNKIISRLYSLNNSRRIREEQGFVTGDGKFLNRIDAAKEAIHCGQLDKLKWPPNLYSEDLY